MKKNGYSLIEILVVLTVFALLATMATQTILLTVRSSRKSEASIKARENLDNAVSVIERQLRNAKSVSGTSSRIDYIDNLGASTNFECRNVSPSTNGYIASGSATLNLTGNNIDLSTCSFTITPASVGVPASVSINLVGSEINSTGVESGNASVNTRIFLRQ